MWRIIIVYSIIGLNKKQYSDFIWEEVDYWIQMTSLTTYLKSKMMKLGYLLLFLPEYRNLLYHRIKYHCNSRLYLIANILFREKSDLFITTEAIGKNLFIQHGFATIISAKCIGSNCWINQQVTIGYSNKYDAPIIGNGVRITAGAKIIGNVYLGDNCIVGANAVVVKDVCENNVVAGVPAHVIHNNHDDKLY